MSVTRTSSHDKVGTRKGAGHALLWLRARSLGPCHSGDIEDVESSYCCAILNAAKQYNVISSPVWAKKTGGSIVDVLVHRNGGSASHLHIRVVNYLYSLPATMQLSERCGGMIPCVCCSHEKGTTNTSKRLRSTIQCSPTAINAPRKK